MLESNDARHSPECVGILGADNCGLYRPPVAQSPLLEATSAKKALPPHVPPHIDGRVIHAVAFGGKYSTVFNNDSESRKEDFPPAATMEPVKTVKPNAWRGVVMFGYTDQRFEAKL